MEREVLEKYVGYFERLLEEPDLETQQAIARDVARFSAEIVERVADSDPTRPIVEASIPMEHWMDDTGFCDLSGEDIESMVDELKAHIDRAP